MDTMPVKTLNTLLRVVAAQGYPVERALQHIGLDFNPLEQDNRRLGEITTESYSKLYRLLMELLQDEAFGLGQGYQAPPGTFRMMCLFVIHCPDLEHALLRAWEFHNYCDQYRGDEASPAAWPILELPDEQVLVVFERTAPPNHQESIAHANVVLMMYRFYSWLIGKPLPVTRVCLRVSEPVKESRYEELFGCPVTFDQAHSGLVLRRSVLRLPVVQTEDSLKEFLRQTPYQLVKRDRPGNLNPLTRRIELLLTGYATEKLPTAEQLANQLNMSPRTLHRKLTAEGTSFQKIKDDYRRELAIHYVSRPELTIDAVATLMGFQDNSAFYRSFKKWTGKSPGSWRQETTRQHGE